MEMMYLVTERPTNHQRQSGATISRSETMIRAPIVIRSLLKRLGSVFRHKCRELASKLTLFFRCYKFLLTA